MDVNYEIFPYGVDGVDGVFVDAETRVDGVKVIVVMALPLSTDSVKNERAMERQSYETPVSPILHLFTFNDGHTV